MGDITPLLELSQCQFSYPHSDTQFQFDLRLDPGDFAVLSGRSGSGKSTLLDLVAGFQHPQKGTVLIDGQAMDHLPPAQRPVSLLMQSHNVFEHLTVLDNICLGPSPNKSPSPKIIEKANRVMEQVGLAGFANRKAHSLSGGQRQRVALAREMLRPTRLMMLDEPFAGLDQETARSIILLFNNLIENQQRTILLVAHELPWLQNHWNRHFRIENGAISELAGG